MKLEANIWPFHSIHHIIVVKIEELYTTPSSALLTETGPGDEDEVADEEELQLNPGHLGPLQLDLLVTHH